MISRIIILILPVFLISQIELTVTTSQPDYEPGENIQIITNSTNNSDETVVIQSASGCLSMYDIDGIFYMACPPVLINFEFSPNETITETFILNMEDFPLEAGIHTVSAYIHYWGIGSSPDDMEYFDEMMVLTATNTFEILENDYDVTLTFDCPADVELGSEGNVLPVDVDASINVMGFQFEIPFDNTIIEITDVFPGEALNDYMGWAMFGEDTLKIISFDFNGTPNILAGSGNLLNIQYSVIGNEGEELLFKFVNVVMSDETGQYIETDVTDTCAVSVIDSDCNQGDVNFDEQIDILDIVLQVNIIMDIFEPTEEQYCAADINVDGIIDILDVILLINIILDILPADCYLEPDIGPCDGICPRYFYNQETEECEMFMWGCCDGIVPFDTLEECEASCY